MPMNRSSFLKLAMGAVVAPVAAIRAAGKEEQAPAKEYFKEGQMLTAQRLNEIMDQVRRDAGR